MLINIFEYCLWNHKMTRENSQILKRLNQPFNLLDDKISRWLFVFLAGFYGSIFVVVYNPLGIDQYLINSHLGQLLPIQFAGVIGASALVITQFVLRPMIGFERLTVLRFIFWSIFELLFISIVLFIVYGERGRPFWNELMITTEKALLLATIPFAIAILTLSLRKKRKTNEHSNSENFGEPTLVSIIDEHGKELLNVRSQDILCLKVEDNYVAISYLTNEKVERKLIRNNLKNMGEMLRDYPIKRIHRSHMINLDHILSIDRKSGKMLVSLAYLKEEKFRVSSSYKSDFELLISERKTSLNPSI